MADKIATRAAYGEFLVEKGREREDLIVMDADLSGSTKTKGFAQAYPDRFVNCGIAEQDLMAEAAGIALGMIVSKYANSAKIPPDKPSRS